MVVTAVMMVHHWFVVIRPAALVAERALAVWHSKRRVLHLRA